MWTFRNTPLPSIPSAWVHVPGSTGSDDGEETDIKANKLPVTDWVNYRTEVARIEEFVKAGATPVAWAVSIDEGGLFASKPRSPIMTEEWTTGYGTKVTMTRWPVAGSLTPCPTSPTFGRHFAP